MANFVPLFIAIGFFVLNIAMDTLLAVKKISPLLSDMKEQQDGSREMKLQLWTVVQLRRWKALFILAHLILGVVYIFFHEPIMQKILYIPSIALFIIEAVGLEMAVADKKLRFLRKPIVSCGIAGLLLAVIGFVVFTLLYPGAMPFFGKGA